jgi:hypothetical protein
MKTIDIRRTLLARRAPSIAALGLCAAMWSACGDA